MISKSTPHRWRQDDQALWSNHRSILGFVGDSASVTNKYSNIINNAQDDGIDDAGLNASRELEM